MSVVQTSILAFERITPALQEREAIVLAALRTLGVASNMELSQQLGWSINRVTGRVFSLRQKGIIESAGIGECKVTGSTVQKWTITKQWW